MDLLLRFLLRFLLIPLGAVAAFVVGALLLVVANWKALQALAGASAQAQEEWFMAFVVAGPLLALFVSMMTAYAFSAAAIGVLISEVFAIRSFVFHAANGGLAAWIGWSLMNDVRDEYRVLGDPTVLVAAGLAGGLAYWLVAGWSAGFLQPLRRDTTGSR